MEVCRHSFIYRSLMVPSQHYSQAEVCTLTLWHCDTLIPFFCGHAVVYQPTFSSWTDGLKCDRFHGQLNEYKAPKLQNKPKSSPVQYQHAWQLTWGICFCQTWCWAVWPNISSLALFVQKPLVVSSDATWQTSAILSCSFEGEEASSRKPHQINHTCWSWF